MAYVAGCGGCTARRRGFEKRAGSKAQTGMEYWMTYGWAILILVIVAVAFYGFGLLNPLTFAGRTVTGFQVLGTPVDWELRGVNGDLGLRLSNGRMAMPVTIYDITATINGHSTTYSTGGLVIAPGVTEDVTFAVTPPLAQGSSYSVKVAITYNTGGLNHTDVGTVTGTVN